MKPVEDMTLEEIEVERAKIRAERAQMNGGYVTPSADVYEPAVPQALADEIYEDSKAVLMDAVDELDVAIQEQADDKPKPWPHQHLSYKGLELEVRIPNESALMAISMLAQLDGHGELQMEIFNTFLKNHLSPTSLADVIKELTRPDSEIGLQGIVQALVKMRIKPD